MDKIRNSDRNRKSAHGKNTLVSIVIPAFNERENIGPLYSELTSVLGNGDLQWEIVFVDDGSNDDTWNEIAILNEKDETVKGIRFSRNFGHQYALYAGLQHATGDAIVCMDADLQHPPEIIPRMIEGWRNGYDIINTVRHENENSTLFKKYTSIIYYKVFSLLTGVTIQRGASDFRLLDRSVVRSILSFDENGLFLRGIVQWIGFTSTKIAFQCRNRFRGKTKYSLRKMIRFALSGVTSFSIIPLRIGIIAGIFTSFIAFILLIHALYSKIILDATVPGWATTVTVMSFMFGILFILIGLLGEYIGRILIEVRKRPRFIVKESLVSRPGNILTKSFNLGKD